MNKLNSDVESESDLPERARLEEKHGKDNVWDTDEFTKIFEVISFAAPFCMVKRRSDGKSGTAMFQHHPRFYFDFREN